MKIRISVLAVWLIVLATPGWADPVKIRMGWVLTPPELPPVFFAKPGVARHLGVSYTYDRPVTYFHMPVPIDRDDEAYFAPLRDLRDGAKTELYLGLVHLGDGVAGAQRRIAAACKFRDQFGIATECGLGRAKTPATVKAIIDLYAEICSVATR